VADIDIHDLEKISDIRLHLEAFSAREAAKNATEDDLVVLEALCQEHAEEFQQLLELDHKFHQAIAQAAHNKYLAEALEHYFGLSQRVWYLALPHLDFLPGAVETHIELVDAIQNKNSDQAENIMRSHIEEFYAKIIKVLEKELSE
jgi:DNA-binding FadR family transcriptional regulator